MQWDRFCPKGCQSVSDRFWRPISLQFSAGKLAISHSLEPPFRFRLHCTPNLETARNKTISNSAVSLLEMASQAAGSGEMTREALFQTTQTNDIQFLQARVRHSMPKCQNGSESSGCWQCPKSAPEPRTSHSKEGMDQG